MQLRKLITGLVLASTFSLTAHAEERPASLKAMTEKDVSVFCTIALQEKAQEVFHSTAGSKTMRDDFAAMLVVFREVWLRAGTAQGVTSAELAQAKTKMAAQEVSKEQGMFCGKEAATRYTALTEKQKNEVRDGALRYVDKLGR